MRKSLIVPIGVLLTEETKVECAFSRNVDIVFVTQTSGYVNKFPNYILVAEQKFIEAEAAFDVNRRRSYEAYLEGIRAYMRKMGVAESEILLYVNSPGVSMGEANLTIDDI